LCNSIEEVGGDVSETVPGVGLSMQPTAATSIAPSSRVTPTLGNMNAQAALKQQTTPDRLRQGNLRQQLHLHLFKVLVAVSVLMCPVVWWIRESPYIPSQEVITQDIPC